MPGHQRIFVVTTAATDAELTRARAELGRDALVLTAPTADAERVVRSLAATPRAEVLLAPVSHPGFDRGHRLDDLVRRHALADRFRDVVVVADPATTTLLLRVLAPDQLSDEGAVTRVGLARGDRPVNALRAVLGGGVVGLVASLLERQLEILALPAVALVLGLALHLVPRWRHVGRELLLVGAVATVAVFLAVAGSARFPAGW
ncbi:hypothetical protein [Nocardioides currus]|uniref:Uncharacterized protein n=1 Tax=Nocardioides currus TaxID=2133958 RepID=A0A2R7YRL8_9ACTN|nr:hypothetical protein [Nocardioides currus]PUA79055.1 hypothetical protein C7S10_21535 [Nocardioides currus]